MSTLADPSQPAATEQEAHPILAVEHLWVRARHATRGQADLVADVSFTIRQKEVVALVGESGSGKSTVCLAVARLLDPGLVIDGGSVRLEGDDLVPFSETQMRRIRGRRIGIVLQDPLSSLNPVRRVGMQLTEARRLHGLDKGDKARAWARQTLASLDMRASDDALDSYPGALSGGMRQRLCTGIAFSCSPALVIADEPTTALDTSLQGRILRLLLDYRDRVGAALLLVSHDLAVVKAVADRVVVMFGGRVLEAGPTSEVLAHPRSPYTRELLRSLPTLDPTLRGRPLPAPPPSIAEPSAAGCPYSGRCPAATDQCRDSFPTVEDDGNGHQVWCWNWRSA